jgi:hypothetical protein
VKIFELGVEDINAGSSEEEITRERKQKERADKKKGRCEGGMCSKLRD